jgi:integrase/recombinase XerD
MIFGGMQPRMPPGPGTPIEIVSKVILRHADLSTTQRYLGKVNNSEAIRWIETLYR